MANLLTPWTVGGHALKNRIVMAPLTRKRATHPERVPTPLMAEMYASRADAGLLITEATDIMVRPPTKTTRLTPSLHCFPHTG